MKGGESDFGVETCPDTSRTDSDSELFHFEARMVTIMLHVILHHKNGKTETKVELGVCLHGPKHAFFPMFLKVAMVMSAAPASCPIRSG